MASALQHGSARSAPEAKALRAGQLARFARALLAHPWWRIALVIQFGSLVLHALALHNGALAAVQPLLAIAIVVALPLNRLLTGQQVTRAEIAWAFALVAGLTGFLLSAAATPAPVVAGGSALTLAAVAAGVTVAIAGCLLLSRRATAGPAAAVLGVAAGAAYAAQALFLQATAGIAAAGGPAALASHAAVYGLLLFGIGGFLLTQLAFRAGPFSAGLPAITATNPLGGVALGVLVNGEGLRSGFPAVAVETLSLAVLTAAVIALGRAPQRSRSPAPSLGSESRQ